MLVRKSRYENFSSVFHPETREEMFTISGNYYHDSDIACFPSAADAGDQIQNNIRIDVVGQDSLESGQQNKSENENDENSNLSPQQIEIPSSRRSSFHGDSMDIDIARSYRDSSPVPLITVSPTRNKVIQ